MVSISQRPCSRWNFAIAIVTGLLALLAPLRCQTPPAAPPDAFEDADAGFLSLYVAARTATIANLGPVLLAEGDKLVLLHHGARTEARVIPRLYDRLKTVSHVPLALYVALHDTRHDGPPIDDAQKSELQQFRARIERVLAALEQAGFSPEQVARSRTLLQHCETLLDHVLEQGHCEANDLLALARFAGPIVIACAADAAKLQIDALHAQVLEFQKSLPADEWAKLRVVVFGPQLPRRHNVATQYFAKLLGTAGETRRLVYAETLHGEQQGLELLASHLLDSDIGSAFFGDPERMEYDLIGNAASVYLDQLVLGN